MQNPHFAFSALARWSFLACVVLTATSSSVRAQQYARYQPTTYVQQAAPATTYVPQPATRYVQQAAPATYQYQYPQQYTYQAAQPAAPTAAAVGGGDPYGFLNWLNATRASYGLSAVGYDPNLSGWAAANNAQQQARGMGHHVMGPARRQNSAMGGFGSIGSMWMASPAHRAALLDPTIRNIGIAGLGAYWTFNAN